MHESKLSLGDDSIINFARPIVEADSQNLYIFSPSGEVTDFSYREAYGLINYNTQNLRFYSLHDLKSTDLNIAFNIEEAGISLPDIQAEHKGEIKLPALNFNNAISLKTETFSIPILQPLKIKFDKASIFIVDLDSIFGSLPARLMKDCLLYTSPSPRD